MIICRMRCGFWKRLFCLFACDEVNEILSRWEGHMP